MPKNIETEVKYKVNNLPIMLPEPLKFRQIYFNGEIVLDILKDVFPSLDFSCISTYRVRKVEFKTIKYIITLKTKAVGYSRGEFEKEISEELFNKLTLNNIESEIIKNRYIINNDKYTFEFDEYLNLKENLFTCEVELENINNNELNNIENILKNYFSLEFLNVSDDIRYRNSNLIKYFGK